MNGRLAALAGMALVAVGLVAARSDDAAPLAPAAVLDRLVSNAQALAAKGRRGEVETLVGVVVALRAPAKEIDGLRASTSKALAKAKPAAGPLPDLAKALAKSAADLAATLPALDDAARRHVAEQILVLDAAQRDAHVALGHVESDGRWVPAAVVPALARRREIASAAQKARELPFVFEEKDSDLPVLERIQGRPGRMVVCGEVAAHSNDFAPGQCVRECRQVMQAYALSNWLRTGTLAFPKLGGRLDMVLVTHAQDYAKGVREALERHEIDASGAQLAAKLTGFQFGNYRLFFCHDEPEIRQFALFHVFYADQSRHGARFQPALVGGHLDWLYGTILGVAMPGIGAIETIAAKSGAGGTHDAPGRADERSQMMRISNAGLAGTRTYIRWLAREREDPPWSRAVADDLSKIEGNALFKSEIVVEYLQETGEFAKLFEETAGKPTVPDTFETRLPGGLAALETRWREWLFADSDAPGVVQILGGAARGGPTSDETAVAARLAEIRKAGCMHPDPVEVDADLSVGCKLHAAYLLKHPERQKAWPDVHVELPDAPEFTPQGSRAGLASVIYPGVAKWDQALDGWMGTFFHRLPLLHPHLLRFGWALEGNVAVLDACSIVGVNDLGSWARWPPADAKDVRRRFTPEMPNPVPGEDQSTWGYPVTLQVWSDTEPTVEMSLHAGTSRAGAVVPCFFTSPTKPLNPDLAPALAWCLIPKQPLAANATYTVAVDGCKVGDLRDWSFTTGK